MTRKKLGKYEIIDRIGRGGMAEVYRGYHPALDRYVAIKLLHPFLANDPEFKDRFENEARNVAKLKHPNIVQVYDFEYDAEGDSFYMIMEMIDGPTLKDRLFDLELNGERIDIAETIRIVKSSAQALAYAHQYNMIHRDVKPANLMLDNDERVVLTDFGIAKIVVSSQFTASGGMIGTPTYMSPEQGLGEPGDERSDIYSLGIILYQLVTGQLPYDAETPIAIILKHVNASLPLPSQFVSDLPPDMEKIICKVLEKEPEARYQTALELVQELNMFDETGHRLPLDPTTGLPLVSALSSFDTKPSPLSPVQRTILSKTEADRIAAETSVSASTSSSIHDPQAAAQPPEVAQSPISGTPGRLNPGGVIGLSASLIVLVFLALIGFGGAHTPFASLLDTSTPQPIQTVVSVTILDNNTSTITDMPSPTNTPSPTDAPLSTSTLLPIDTPSPTSTLPPTNAPSPTDISSPTPIPTLTAMPSPTGTSTPDATVTALVDFYETQKAATSTPNVTLTLMACDLGYIINAPDHHDEPPPFNDANNPRLIQARSDFSLEIVFQNMGSCPWPEDARLTYNSELTEHPDSSVDLSAFEAVCEEEDRRSGLNFARQRQSNFYLPDAVGVTEGAAPLTFNGIAPDVFGCYYSVWDLLYPNSDLPIGHPLVLTIRVWGGG